MLLLLLLLPLLLALLQDVLQDLRVQSKSESQPSDPHPLPTCTYTYPQVFMANFCTCCFSVVLFSASQPHSYAQKLLHIWSGHKFPIVLVPPAYEDIQLNTKHKNAYFIYDPREQNKYKSTKSGEGTH